MNNLEKNIALAKAMGYRVDYIDNIRSPQRYQLHRVEQDGVRVKDTTAGWGYDETEAWTLCPKFDTDWAAMGMVLEWISQKGYVYRIEHGPNWKEVFVTLVDVSDWDNLKKIHTTESAATVPQAVRDAVLNALGVKNAS